MAAKSQEIQQFIVDHLEQHPRDIVRVTVEHFGISRQAINRHLRILLDDEVINATGRTSERTYSLAKREATINLLISENQAEDLVYRQYVAPLLEGLKKNIQEILYYAFTEMFNNVIDHSEGTSVTVAVTLTARNCSISIFDNGIGIFERIKKGFALHDHREAILELSKGKLTTDARCHSGQGIFFTSRMVDRFALKANALFFWHNRNSDDWLIETDDEPSAGTFVSMEMFFDSTTTMKEVFDNYTDLESGDYAFSKTHVPIALAKYRDENLISRSQAKRILSRFDRFEEVFLDFHGVSMIGQAFADEIFRVFKRNHPTIKLIAINTTPEVLKMIHRAQSTDDSASATEP